jgi:hypothetical protein
LPPHYLAEPIRRLEAAGGLLSYDDLLRIAKDGGTRLDDIQQDQKKPATNLELGSLEGPAEQSDDLTRAFVRLNNLATCPLDRLSRYEATLWRQACQILWTLQCLGRRKPWERRRLR